MKPYLGLSSKKQQQINEDDIQSVVDVLRSNHLTQGPMIEAFEESVSGFCEANYAVAVNSATSALHLTCLAMGLGAGDYLWTTPNTFVASSNCALYCGARVDFIDIDNETYNIDVDKLEAKLIHAKSENRLPKIIIPVHFSGNSVAMHRVASLAKQYGFKVIEDASHAMGASFNHRPVGSCEFSDACVFSFHPVKITTAGEGGMVLTNHQDLAEKIYYLRSHGVTRDPAKMSGEIHGSWYYQQIELGYNYRMTDIQAALGLSQQNRVKEFVAKRNEIAEYYDSKLQGTQLILPKVSPNAKSSRHLYVVRFPHVRNLAQKRTLFDAFWKQCVPVNVHYIPVHTQPYYQNLGFKVGDFPVAEQYYLEAFSIPIHVNLDLSELDHIVEVTKTLSESEQLWQQAS